MGNSRVRVVYSVIAAAALGAAGVGTAHAMSAATTSTPATIVVTANDGLSPKDSAKLRKEYNNYSKKLEAHLKSKGINLKFVTDEDGFYDIDPDTEISEDAWKVIEKFDTENGPKTDLGDISDEDLAAMKAEYNKVSDALEKLLKEKGHNVPFVTDDEGFKDVDPNAEISEEAWKLIEDYLDKHVGDVQE